MDFSGYCIINHLFLFFGWITFFFSLLMLFSGIFLVEIFGIKKDIAVIIKSVVLYHDGNLYESVELPKHTTKFDNFKVLNYRNKMVTIWWFYRQVIELKKVYPFGTITCCSHNLVGIELLYNTVLLTIVLLFFKDASNVQYRLKGCCIEEKFLNDQECVNSYSGKSPRENYHLETEVPKWCLEFLCCYGWWLSRLSYVC
jgi:hypothetical protein